MEYYSKKVAQIMDALAQKPGVGLVLYGAGLLCRTIIVELAKYGISPLCICDSDQRLHGTEINGIKVMRIDEARERFAKFLLYIASEQYLCEIIYQLTKNAKATKDQIINYVPVMKIYSCKYIQERCNLNTPVVDRLYFCCSIFEQNVSPFVSFDGDYNKLVNDFVALREKTIHEQRENIPNACSGCRELTNIYVPAERGKITFVNYSGFDACNFLCSYCFVRRNPKPAKLKLPVFVQVLREKNLLDENAICISASGEITIYPERNEIYECLRTFAKSLIFTNALIYDSDIAELMNSGNTSIYVSMDAGTRETFAEIKGLDVFDRVCGTLRRYAKNSEKAMTLKYILLPGINDNEPEIDGFFRLACEIGARSVIVSSDQHNSALVTDHMIRMAEYFRCKAQGLSIPCETNSDIISNVAGIRSAY